jgi:hypothetical protein
MDTWDSIILELGGTRAVAGALTQSESTVSGWRTRGIPVPHWAGVVALASERDVSGVTLESLAVLAMATAAARAAEREAKREMASDEAAQ